MYKGKVNCKRPKDTTNAVYNQYCVQKIYIRIKMCILYVFCMSIVIFLEGCK